MKKYLILAFIISISLLGFSFYQYMVHSKDDASITDSALVGLFYKKEKIVGDKEFTSATHGAVIGIQAPLGWHIQSQFYFNQEKVFNLNYKFGDDSFSKEAGFEFRPPSRKSLTLLREQEAETITLFYPINWLPAISNRMTFRLIGSILLPDKQTYRLDYIGPEEDYKCINIEFTGIDVVDSVNKIITPRVFGCG